MDDRDTTEQKTYSATDVSQGETVLRRPWQKIIFFGGLVVAVLVGIVFGAPHFF